MQIFRGCYPFTDARTEVFQVPLTWFTLMYFCIYTALLYPIRDASGAGIHVLLRAKSRALWWFSKCLALTVWNLLYFAVGFCSVCVFCFFTNGLSCFTILPHDVLPCDALTCLLPFGFALAISLLAFCLCIFCSFVWGQVFAIKPDTLGYRRGSLPRYRARRTVGCNSVGCHFGFAGAFSCRYSCCISVGIRCSWR